LLVSEELTLKVDYNDLSEYIKHIYGKEFDIIDDQEKGNDSLCDVRVTGKLDKYAKDSLEKWLKTGRHSYLLSAVMNDLCDKKLIKPGYYVVYISW
jgi:hypothetical protein